MKITAKRAVVPALATLASAVLLAGCAQAPGSGPSESQTVAPTTDFLSCMISDSGGFDDHSFNQLGYEGLQKAVKEIGGTEKDAESQTDADYANNISTMVAQNCDLIITVGYLLADATKEGATANPDTDFAIIDDQSIDLPNVQPIIFDTAQAAFLGGYAAASYSKTGVVGTFGGLQIPTVTIFMDGFADGVAYYNQQKGADVQVVGWNVKTKKGAFTGGFEANDKAKNTAQGILDQDADVIMPVGGPIYQSAAAAITDSKKDIALIGVDADVYLTDPSVKSLLLTSVMKGIGPSVEAVVKAAAGGEFSNEPYVGTLANDGVGLAPFHDYESKVDPGLSAELEQIKAGIIDGSITVDSPSSPE